MLSMDPAHTTEAETEAGTGAETGAETGTAAAGTVLTFFSSLSAGAYWSLQMQIKGRTRAMLNDFALPSE